MPHAHTDTQLTELALPEEPVLELLNSVSVAKRVASLALHSEGFGLKQATNRKKAEDEGRLVKRADRRVGGGHGHEHGKGKGKGKGKNEDAGSGRGNAKATATVQAAGQGGAGVRRVKSGSGNVNGKVKGVKA